MCVLSAFKSGRTDYVITSMIQNLLSTVSQWLASPVFVSAQLTAAYVFAQLGIPVLVGLALWLTISRRNRISS